jgi:serine protease Do
MSTKSVIVAISLIALGIIFGVVLVSNFQGIGLGLAQEKPKIGNQEAAPAADDALVSLNKAFSKVSASVTPSIVYVFVKSTPQAQNDEGNSPTERYFHFFMPRKPEPEVGAGSGIIISADGYILTNNHVVENADAEGIKITLSDTREFKAKVIGTDKTTDLAVIKIEAENLTPAFIGNSDEVEVGHIVFAFGNPLNLRSTMTMGIVSAVGRQLRIIEDNASGMAIEDFIQTDAAINPGNSGGALVNINGQVIGVNAAIATTNARYQGYAFAIPINLAKTVAADLISYGKVRRGYIGVQIQTIDATLAKSLGLEKAQGVIVQNVNKGSGGEDAGIQPGDVILSVNGKSVNSANQLQSTIALKHPGDKVTLKIFRNKKYLDVDVTLKGAAGGETPTEPVRDQPEDSKKNSEPKQIKLEKLGFSVKPLDDDAKKKYDVRNGVYVDGVDPYGIANTRALFPGDVIVSVNNKDIQSVKQFQKAMDELKPGEAVLMRVKRADKTPGFVALEIPK